MCCVSVIGALLALTLKKYNPDISMLVAIATSLVLFFGILSAAEPVIQKLKELFDSAGVPSEYCVIVLKVLGVCFLCQFACDTCKDAGQSSIASCVELLGKLVITVITLPLITEIISTATKLIGG